jgi:hypothetical protein
VLRVCQAFSNRLDQTYRFDNVSDERKSTVATLVSLRVKLGALWGHVKGYVQTLAFCGRTCHEESDTYNRFGWATRSSHSARNTRAALIME